MAESNNAKTTYSAMSTKQKRKVDNRILEEEDPEEKALGKYVRSQPSSSAIIFV
jgi:hypothetical protein